MYCIFPEKKIIQNFRFYYFIKIFNFKRELCYDGSQINLSAELLKELYDPLLDVEEQIRILEHRELVKKTITNLKE